ncbi:MAG TPA: glycosyltransferase family 2 protein [Candidatus Paceibacterota bacterium]|nr:glycosyltransferase family 2 protein [Candidatus Paceibacterota bacterium]
MKISIVTICYNSASTIEGTIKSVLSQNYPDVEYIIIDGGSTDRTVDIIKKYQDKIAHFVSEKDRGIYDAMNKGVRLATGDVVGILNSDDLYADDGVLESVARALDASPSSDACYGDLVYVDQADTNKITRTWRSGDFSEAKIRGGWIVPHPAFFPRRQLYERLGYFRLDLRLAGDYELLLRWIEKGKIKMTYVPKVFVRMREGGDSNKSIGNRLEGWRNLRDSWIMNGLTPPPFFILRRVITQLPQFFKKNTER